MNMILRVVISALAGAVIGIITTYLTWNPSPPIDIIVYQEMRAANAKEGFEELAGYSGKLPFFWRELVATREYRRAVIAKLGRNWIPGTLLEAPSVERHIHIGELWTENLYLTVSQEQWGPPDSYREELIARFQAYAGVFIETAASRGEKLEPLGKPTVIWRSKKSLADIMGVEVLSILLASIVTGILVEFMIRKKAKAAFPLG